MENSGMNQLCHWVVVYSVQGEWYNLYAEKQVLPVGLFLKIFDFSSSIPA